MTTERRKCQLCGTPYARVADSVERRVYSCDDGCGAYEVITKGSCSGWWYHGAQLPEHMAPAWLEIATRAFDAADAH